MPKINLRKIDTPVLREMWDKADQSGRPIIAISRELERRNKLEKDLSLGQVPETPKKKKREGTYSPIDGSSTMQEIYRYGRNFRR